MNEINTSNNDISCNTTTITETIENNNTPPNPKVHLMNHKMFVTAQTESVVQQNVIEFIKEQDPDILTVDGLSPSLLEAEADTEFKERHQLEVEKESITRDTLNALSIIKIDELRENQSLVFADMPSDIKHLAFALEGYKNINRAQINGDKIAQTVPGLLNALSTPAATTILLPMIYLATEAKRSEQKGEKVSRRDFLKIAATGITAGAATALTRLLLEHSPEKDLVKIYNYLEFLDIESTWIDLRNIRMRMANQQEVEEKSQQGLPSKSIVLLGTGHGSTIDPNVNDPDYDINEFKVESRTKLLECFQFMRLQLEKAEIPITDPIIQLLRRSYSEYYTVFKDEYGDAVKQKKNIKDVDILINLTFRGVKG